MKGKNETLLEFGCKGIGISYEDVRFKLSCAGDELSPHDKLQFISIGIPCMEMGTKQDVVDWLYQLGLSMIPEIKKLNSRSMDKSWNRLVKQIGIDKAYELLCMFSRPQNAWKRRFFDIWK